MQMQKMDSIGKLAGGVAHDFNNLLEGILGYTNYIKQLVGKDTPVFRELETIEEIAYRGTALTKQLLTISKGNEYQVRPVDINQLVQEVCRLFSRTMNKNIRVVRHTAEGLPPIDGDEGQLQQVLLNICLNARDAMPQGGEMEISTQEVYLDERFAEANPWARPGRYVVLRVKDTGMGIPEEVQERIFEPFFTTKGEREGTGLGLSIAYSIVTQHKGHIAVDSRPGRGAVFSIYLPVSAQAARAEKRVEAAAGKEAKGATILVVDDDEIIRHLAENVLTKSGYKVLLAPDGRQAVDMMRKAQDKVDLVILDMIDPKMRGEETYRLLKEIRSNIRVLLSSGGDLDAPSRRLISEGEGDFISKPYRPQELLSKVQELLNKE